MAEKRIMTAIWEDKWAGGRPLPRFNNSPKDGYILHKSDNICMLLGYFCHHHHHHHGHGHGHRHHRHRHHPHRRHR